MVQQQTVLVTGGAFTSAGIIGEPSAAFDTPVQA